ncbi:uncharacterized protein [Dendropsophus ebraccatus]|uniref:uncharacterized protein isoform X2 n=1 Tax=Dendropsophus ebraccatus TaxID=150705 RepID=UPI003831BDDC
MFNAIRKSSENMKKSLTLWCFTCFFLSTLPKNQGSKLKESLNCVLEYSENIVTCSWSESRISRKFLNMSLMEIKERARIPMCEKMGPVKLTPTHLNWTCHRNFSGDVLYGTKHLIFLPDRSLETRLNMSNEGDEAKPKNLHCQASGDGMIHCSWEVRQEVADSVDFTLYYWNDSRKEEACQPRCWQENTIYLSCTCKFTAGHHDNPIQFHNISVRPTESESSFITLEICKHIKLLPRILTIEEKTKGETFLVRWEKAQSEMKNFRYYYQLCYWREIDVKPNEESPECPGIARELSPNDEPTVRLILGTHLQPRSNYSVKVRVRLGEEDPDHCYKGPWSEWSNVQTLHTKSVLSMLLLCILVLSAVVVLVICAVCGCKALVRYKKQLDDRIPNPSKSSIVKSLRKTKNGPSFPNEEHLYVEPCNKVSMWAPSLKDTSHPKEDEEQTTRPNSDLLQDDDTQCLFLFSMIKEDYPTASIADGYKPFSELIDEQENKDMEESQFTACAFDGPYLFSSSNVC